MKSTGRRRKAEWRVWVRRETPSCMRPMEMRNGFSNIFLFHFARFGNIEMQIKLVPRFHMQKNRPGSVRGKSKGKKIPSRRRCRAWVASLEDSQSSTVKLWATLHHPSKAPVKRHFYVTKNGFILCEMANEQNNFASIFFLCYSHFCHISFVDMFYVQLHRFRSP